MKTKMKNKPIKAPQILANSFGSIFHGFSVNSAMVHFVVDGADVDVVADVLAAGCVCLCLCPK